MITKTCLNCGESFIPKRSDAICCSDKCRSAYNYKKKQHKANDLLVANTAAEVQNTEKDVIIKGEIGTKFLIDKTKECETKMELINDQIALFETSKAKLYAQISDLNAQILSIENGDKTKLLRISTLSDLTLYNTFLNEVYLAEKKKGNEFAYTRLKSESDLNSLSNPKYRIAIENYRKKVAFLIKNQDLKIATIEQRIAAFTNEIDQHSAKIKELQNQLRFYESRVLKFETMLLSV